MWHLCTHRLCLDIGVHHPTLATPTTLIDTHIGGATTIHSTTHRGMATPTTAGTIGIGTSATVHSTTLGIVRVSTSRTTTGHTIVATKSPTIVLTTAHHEWVELRAVDMHRLVVASRVADRALQHALH